MRILYCNKYNYLFSGTESYLFDLMRRVEACGHESALFSMDHAKANAFAGHSYLVPLRDFKNPQASVISKARSAAHALYSRSARKRMRQCLRDFSPDIAHVRNIYHHLSPSVLWELKRHRIPVIYHLNDFKLLCPAYNLVSRGRSCEVCAKGHYFRVIKNGCYASPWYHAAVLAAEAYLHRWLQTYERCVDLFLAPSEFVREKLTEGGFDSSRIEVLPHFQEAPPDEQLASDEGYVLYFGRLSAEKGVDELLHAMVRTPQIPLIVAGDGPERERLQGLARDLHLTNVLFMGELHGEELQNLIARASFSVFPSRAYETLGKSILESNAWGRPVIATDLGSRRELIDHGVTGLLYEAGSRDQLASAVELLFSRPDLVSKMGRVARERVREKHDPKKHVRAMIEIYSRLIAAKRKSVSSALPKSPSQPIRVAFIGGRGVVSKYSGIESYYERVGSELAQLGHQVTVYCRNYFTPKIREHHGMRIVRLPTIRTKHLETVVHTMLSTVHAMFSNCEIVHYHALGPALFSFLPRLAGKKTVVTVQGLDWQRRKWGVIASRVLQAGELASALFPNRTMVVSRTLQKYYRERYGRPTAYVPNGTELISRTPIKRLPEWGLSPQQYVLFLGRLSPEKNCHLLIEAFVNVHTEAKLVLAGGSSHSDAYVKELLKHESDRVRFLPWVSGDDLEELLSNAALFVLPSDLEGMSLALLDAMGAGVCVLTSDVPENCEVVSGVGFTFRRGDQDDLEEMLNFLLRNPELRADAAAKAKRRIASQFLWPGIARSIEAIYVETLGREAAARSESTEQAGVSLLGECNLPGTERVPESKAAGY